uniref:Nuclear FMR1 interacting protein 2 n=1 Tax=Fundulus heteroclitus TaxID=8078 RepID=A0A3Q2SRJ5_FUNHE
MSYPSSSNGNRHISNPNVKQKGPQKHYAPVQKVSSKLPDHKKNMDLRNDREKALDAVHNESQPSDKKDSASLQNGLVNCGLITNGYSSKDNDGSGSEGGYTTPKKRKSRCGVARSADSVTKEKERDMQPRNTTQEPGAPGGEAPEKGAASRLDGFRPAYKVEAQTTAKRAVASETSVAESQRKTSDAKAAGTFAKKAEEKHKGKLSSPSKEDSWTLFKPPPVFPVDNSSAKIVPKISYASKVKENLNKVAQASLESNCSSATSPGDGEASDARHLDPPAVQTNQKALGDIFQNQWGLSFINEPNLGPDGGNGLVPADDQTSVTSYEGEAVAAEVAQPLFVVSPSFIEAEAFSQDAEKRTCAPCQVSSITWSDCLPLLSHTDPKRVVFYDETNDGPDK